MLLVPLALGWAVAGDFGSRGILFALASLALFFARYPLTLLFRAWLGRAMSRPPQAGKWLALYSLASLGFILPLFYPYRLWWLLPMGALALALFLISLYMVKERQERTEFGEMIGIAGLTLAAPGAHYSALGLLEADALYLWFLCLLYFGASVFYVKMRVRHRALKSEPPAGWRWQQGRDTALYHLALVPILLGLALAGRIPILAPLAFLPLLLKSLAAVALPNPGMSIRRVGFTELGHSLVFGALLALAYWSSGEAV